MVYSSYTLYIIQQRAHVCSNPKIVSISSIEVSSPKMNTHTCLSSILHFYTYTMVKYNVYTYAHHYILLFNLFPIFKVYLVFLISVCYMYICSYTLIFIARPYTIRNSHVTHHIIIRVYKFILHTFPTVSVLYFIFRSCFLYSII